jgi:hypothetical protein
MQRHSWVGLVAQIDKPPDAIGCQDVMDPGRAETASIIADKNVECIVVRIGGRKDKQHALPSITGDFAARHRSTFILGRGMAAIASDLATAEGVGAARAAR